MKAMKIKSIPGAGEGKAVQLKSGALPYRRLKSVKITFKENPAWKKQLSIVKREMKKLSKMDIYFIVS